MQRRVPLWSLLLQLTVLLLVALLVLIPLLWLLSTSCIPRHFRWGGLSGRSRALAAPVLRQPSARLGARILIAAHKPLAFDAKRRRV